MTLKDQEEKDLWKAAYVAVLSHSTAIGVAYYAAEQAVKNFRTDRGVA